MQICEIKNEYLMSLLDCCILTLRGFSTKVAYSVATVCEWVRMQLYASIRRFFANSTRESTQKIKSI